MAGGGDVKRAAAVLCAVAAACDLAGNAECFALRNLRFRRFRDDADYARIGIGAVHRRCRSIDHFHAINVRQRVLPREEHRAESQVVLLDAINEEQIAVIAGGVVSALVNDRIEGTVQPRDIESGQIAQQLLEIEVSAALDLLAGDDDDGRWRFTQALARFRHRCDLRRQLFAADLRDECREAGRGAGLECGVEAQEGGNLAPRFLRLVALDVGAREQRMHLNLQRAGDARADAGGEFAGDVFEQAELVAFFRFAQGVLAGGLCLRAVGQAEEEHGSQQRDRDSSHRHSFTGRANRGGIQRWGCAWSTLSRSALSFPARRRRRGRLPGGSRARARRGWCGLRRRRRFGPRPV